MSNQNISKNNKVEKGNMVFGDNNTVENNITETHIHHHYDTDNSHNAPEKYGLNRMREGLERHIGTILQDCEALIIPYLQTNYTVPSDIPEFKGKGQKVKAYTVLNICDSEGNLLADHAQLDLKGITIYGFPKFNIPEKLEHCTNRIRFTAYIKDYVSRGRTKTGIYVVNEPSFISDTVINNPFKSTMFKVYSELERDDIRFYFENITARTELKFLVDQYIVKLTRMSEYLAQPNFIINYIFSMLFLRTKQPHLVRGELELLIDSLSIHQLKTLLKCLSFTIGYIYTVDSIRLVDIIRYSALFIIQQFGISHRQQPILESDDFKNWCFECFKSSREYILLDSFKSCVYEICKDFKFNNKELSSDINDMYNLYTIWDDANSQINKLREEEIRIEQDILN